MVFGFLISMLFFWLFFKTVGLTLRLTWGVAKLVAGLLMVIALPVLILGLLFSAGVVLLVPLILLALAGGIVKACVNG